MLIGGGWVGEWNVDKRDRWGWTERNSAPVGMLSSRVREVSSLQARDPGSRTKGGSSSSSSEGKKSDNGLFFRVLGRDSGYKSSHQLELFEVEMVAGYESTVPVGQARSFVTLGPR